jgi:DNA-binding NtrC family response regulator
MFGQTANGTLLGRTSTIGCLRSADGGSILLRNVDRLSLDEQAALAEVLKSQCINLENESHRINVRVFSTSSHNLDQEVKAGRFRVDLYYLLSATTVDCPALADRPEDIGALMSFFLAKLTLEYGVNYKQVSSAAMALLKSYDWPGNIAEIESTIETAVRISAHELTLEITHFAEIAERIQQKSLESEFSTDEIETELISMDVVNGTETVESLPLVAPSEQWLTLAEAESLHIRRTLEQAEFNATVAAAMLGISLNSFRQKLERYRLQNYLSSKFDKT